MVSFSYNGSGVTLRDPDFDNNTKLELSRINTKTRGGDQIIFRDPMWPVATILDMTFSFLSEQETRDLLQFLDYSLGQIVLFVNYDGRAFYGIITTPSGDVAQPGRQNKTAKLTFQTVEL